MSILLALSKYISVPILCDWLNVEDFLLLDSAFCNKLLRNKFLRLCSEQSRNFQALFRTHTIVTNQSTLQWFAARKMFPHSLMLTHYSLNPQKLKWWNLRAKKHLYRQNEWIYECLKQIQCLNLQDIVFQDCNRMYQALNLCSARELIITGKFCNKDYNVPQSQYPLKFTILRYVTNSNIFHCPLLRQCSVLLEIHDSGEYFQDFRMLTAVVVSCRHLVCFNVCMASTTAQYILAFHAGVQMKRLFVTAATTNLLTTLLWYRGGSSLTHLSLKNAIDEADLDLISFICPHVSTLQQISYRFQSDLPTGIGKLKNLTYLALTECTIPVYTSWAPLLETTPIKSLSVIEGHFNVKDLSSTCQLETLIITHRSNDSDLLLLGKFCPLLTVLDVSYCDNVGDDGLAAILSNGRIVRLNICETRCTGKTLKLLAETCPIKELNTTVKSVEGLCYVIQRCRTLRLLYCLRGDVWKLVLEYGKKKNKRLKIVLCHIAR